MDQGSLRQVERVIQGQKMMEGEPSKFLHRRSALSQPACSP